MADFATWHRFLEDAWDAFTNAPLSKRKAMLFVMLADGLLDELFEHQTESDDRIEFRQKVAAHSSSLALMMKLAAHRPEGPTLVLAEHKIPVAHYGSLSVEDFMVSLYNDHSVQRLMVDVGDGEPIAAEYVLKDALAELLRLSPPVQL